MRMIRSVTFGGPSRRIDLGARVARLRSAMQRGNAERAKLYASGRWRKERRAFLKLNPHCVTPGCMQRATVVDHRDGHQREDWAGGSGIDALGSRCAPTVTRRSRAPSWRNGGKRVAGYDARAPVFWTKGGRGSSKLRGFCRATAHTLSRGVFFSHKTFRNSSL